MFVDVKRGSCTELGGNRYGPNLGGCCPGLKEVNEPRPKSNAVFCEPGHPNHGKGCWSRVKMCRSGNSWCFNTHQYIYIYITANHIEYM